MKLTILCDDSADSEELKTSWGFSCIVGDNFLFDSGQKAEELSHNMNVLGVDPMKIDYIMISHDHWDHQGGIDAVLDKRKNVKVYGLSSFSPKLKKHIAEKGSNFIAVTEYREIVPGIFSTGQVKGNFNGTPIWEHSVLIHNSERPTLLTGCAHPGIVKLIRLTYELTGQPAECAIGGFHLMKEENGRLTTKVKKLFDLSLKKIAPAHCTGNNAVMEMKRVFGDKFVTIKAGSVLEV